MIMDLNNEEELKKRDYNASSPPQPEPTIEGAVGFVKSWEATACRGTIGRKRLY